MRSTTFNRKQLTQRSVRISADAEPCHHAHGELAAKTEARLATATTSVIAEANRRTAEVMCIGQLVTRAAALDCRGQAPATRQRAPAGSNGSNNSATSRRSGASSCENRRIVSGRRWRRCCARPRNASWYRRKKRSAPKRRESNERHKRQLACRRRRRRGLRDEAENAAGQGGRRAQDEGRNRSACRSWAAAAASTAVQEDLRDQTFYVVKCTDIKYHKDGDARLPEGRFGLRCTLLDTVLRWHHNIDRVNGHAVQGPWLHACCVAHALAAWA